MKVRIKKPLIDRRQIIRSAGAGAGLLGLSTFTGYAPAIAQTLPLVNVVTGGGSASLVVIELLKRLNTFKELGVNADVQVVSDGNKAMSGLVGGSSDIAVGLGFAQIFPAAERGGTVKIVAAASFSPTQAIFSKRPDIKTVKDLAGKTIGIGALGSLYHELMLAILAKKGVDASTVHFVNVGSIPDIFRAVVAGTVDAGPGLVDVYDQQEKYGVHALSDGVLWVELPEFTNQASFASTDAITGKRDGMTRTLAAFAKVYRYITDPKNKDEFISANNVAMGTNDPAQGLAQWTFVQKYKPYAVDLVMSQERVDYIQQLNKSAGVQKTILPYDQVADMSLAKDAIKMLG